MILLADFTTFVSEGLVPLFGVFFVFGLPVLAFVYLRVLKHRERMEMIRNGIAPGDLNYNEKRMKGANARGARESYASNAGPADNVQNMLRKGITLTFIGFALTIGLSFIGYHSESNALPGMMPVTSWEPGPWLLGGLIPLFVGLAQVVIAVLSGATLGPVQTPRFEPHVVEEPAAASRDTGTFDGPYTYRPGSTQELIPPRTPPERKF